MGRKKQDPARRRNEFIAAGLRLFREKGFENTSLNDILRVLGGDSPLSPSVFYYYFKSKDELLNECLNSYVDEYADDMIRFLSDESTGFAVKMNRILTRISEALRAFSGIVADESRMNAAFHDLLADRFFTRILPALSGFISDGLEKGLLPKTELSQKADTEIIARLICNGAATLLHRSVLLLPGAAHDFGNVPLIPVFIAQILGISSDTLSLS